MRFINVWSYSFARQLSNQLNESHEKRSVYYYGFQVIIGAIVKAVLMISLAIITGTLIPSLVILFVFGSLRMLAGGFHMDTYGKCIATSTILFLGCSIIAQYTYIYWNIALIACIFAAAIILGIYIIIRWAPKDTPNKPITKSEDIKKYKRLSLYYMGAWSVINAVLLYYGHARDYQYLNLIVISSCMGLLLEVFMVTPAGYALFEKIRDWKK